jgi:hypothetical protein
MKRQFDTVRFTDVVDAYKRLNPKGTWFDADRVKAVKMNLPNMAYDVPTGWLFITAEPNEEREIRFTVRRMSRAGEIFNVGQHNMHLGRPEATEAIKALAQQ